MSATGYKSSSVTVIFRATTNFACDCAATQGIAIFPITEAGIKANKKRTAEGAKLYDEDTNDIDNGKLKRQRGANLYRESDVRASCRCCQGGNGQVHCEH